MNDKSSKFSNLFSLGIASTALVHSPFVTDPYTPAKWIWIYAICLISLFISIFLSKRATFPSGKLIKFTFVLIIFCEFIAVVLSPQLSYLTHFVDWACFGSLVVISFNLLNDKTSLFRLCYFTSIASFLVFLIPLIIPLGIFFSTFGYPNMIAEFLGISIILQVFTVLNSEQKPALKSLLICSLFINISYLILLSSRASIVGVYFMTPLLLIGHDRKKLLTLFLTFAIAPLAVHSLKDKILATDNLAKNKAQSSQVRLVRWMNTIHMIQKNPLGVGPGGYEFSYIPFNHSYAQDAESNISSIVQSPHNGYLELIVEYGIFGGCLILLSLLLIIREAIKRYVNSLNKTELSLPLAGLGFLFIDAFFAFPMEVPIPFSYFAVFSGILLQNIAPPAEMKTKLYFPLLTLFTILLGHFALDIVVAKVYEGSKSKSTTHLIDACKRMPENWQVCAKSVDAAMTFKLYVTAEGILKDQLRRSPNNFMALERMASLKLKTGDRKEGCKYLTRYIDLMGENNKAGIFRKNNCNISQLR